MAMTEKQAAAKEWLNRNFCKHEELQALYMKLDDMRAGSVKAVAQKYQQQNYGGFVPSQGAPQAPDPPPVPDNLPPDPFAGIPFSLY